MSAQTSEAAECKPGGQPISFYVGVNKGYLIDLINKLAEKYGMERSALIVEMAELACVKEGWLSGRNRAPVAEAFAKLGLQMPEDIPEGALSLGRGLKQKS